MKNLTKTASIFSQAAQRSNVKPPTTILPSIAGVREYSSFSILNPYSSSLSRIFPKSSPSNFAGQSIRQFSQKSTPAIEEKDIKIITLFPDREEDFQTFKKIITNKDVIFTSSWMNECFGIDNLKQHCSEFGEKLKLAKLARKGMEEIFVSRQELKEYNSGKPAAQVALNSFFDEEENNKKLRVAYEKMTAESLSELGYYKFIDKADGKLLGGGALVPLEKDGERVTKVDIALHILESKQGIGTVCINILLKNAFDKHGIKEVWGSSIIQHLGTPTLCAKYGMIIYNDEESKKKYYYIDEDMYRHNITKFESMRQPLSAAKQYFSEDKSGNDMAR